MERIVAVTDGLATELSRLYSVPRDRLCVVENAANTTVFHPLDKIACRRRLGLDTDCRWLCFEGSLQAWHGLDTLLRALKLLEREEPPIRLVVVGDGPMRNSLQMLTRELGLESRVRFVGRVPYDEVPEYIGASDIGVGSFTRIRNEKIGSSSMKIFEYVACGRPVVVSRLPGVGDWVEREGLGLLAEPDNPRDFAAKTLAALKDSKLIESLPQIGPQVVERDHSWAAVSRKVSSVLESLVA